jgi:hypothetical protein
MRMIILLRHKSVLSSHVKCEKHIIARISLSSNTRNSCGLDEAGGRQDNSHLRF